MTAAVVFVAVLLGVGTGVATWAVWSIVDTTHTRRRPVRGWVALHRLKPTQRKFAWVLGVGTPGAVHMMPEGDAVTHTELATCPCSPRVEHLSRGVLVTHHRGRVTTP